jgi:rhamnopyranosyl-N-acetylglucosaminyl-diphospho-decaprenol beta-1,3/1,4-galactofuranosyltransferase
MEEGRRNRMDPVQGRAPEGVTAVVLTFMRPRLATEAVRSLMAQEGFSPDRIVVVVNGIGGLDDADLEEKVTMVRLPRNTGPAGGFRAGMETVFARPETQWAYLCEDDIGLFSLPSPRVVSVLERLGAHASPQTVGAVVAYGRRFVGRGAHTVNVVPEVQGVADLVPVDVACWGASLVSRRVFGAGVLPDPEWFFGLEDFDFFCRVRKAGLEVMVDGQAARSVAGQQTTAGRDAAIRADRPGDADEAWRSYYHSRNSVELARRHGHPSWHLWHLAYSARHLQLAGSRSERSAILRGLWDGARGRMGEDPRFRRQVGEFDPAGPPAR